MGEFRGTGRAGGLRCALVGDEPLVAQCAEIARSHGIEVVLVASDHELVRADARAHGIPVVGNGRSLAEALDAHPADVLFSVANLHVVPDDVLGRVRTAINYHDGPLPAYAGLNVTTWALLAGERDHAITWHLMTSDVDGGAVISTEQFPIAHDDTAFSLNARCYEAALASFPRIAAALASGTLNSCPQPSGPRHVSLRHDRPARLLDVTAPAAHTARAVRALDLGHRVRNGVGALRWVLGDEVVVVDRASADESTTSAPAGTLLSSGGGRARVATTAGDLVIEAVSTPEGATADLDALLAPYLEGAILPETESMLATRLVQLEPRMSRDELAWLDRLCATSPTVPPLVQAGGRFASCTRAAPGSDGATALAAVAVWLRRTTGATSVSMAVTDAAARDLLAATAPLTRPGIVLLEVPDDATFADVCAATTTALTDVSQRHPLLRDAIGRDPRTRGRTFDVPVRVDVGIGTWSEPLPTGVTLRVGARPGELVVDGLVPRDDEDALARIAEQLGTLLAAGIAHPDVRVTELPVLGPTDLALLDALNRTDLRVERAATIDAQFRAQAEATPDAPALSCGERTLTYAELGSTVGTMAGRLAAVGVGRGDRVGIAVPRGVDMVVTVLATLQLGAAYVPLDPTYPTERLAFMVADAGLAVLVATGSSAAELTTSIPVVDPSADAGVGEGARGDHDGTDLAYLIYTSGSTGLPKGVMLEHRQVVNFFEAMDRVVDTDPPGVWLAVTSLSFDISVLELLWTLTRGFHVVSPAGRSGMRRTAPAVAAPARPLSFSLFYFAAGEEAAADGYRLLLETARVADRNGFAAVWTPERHFHAFGGAYPNPSVTGAALAAVTTNVGIRAGSVVMPLHSPIRVAEEWAVVDNLSRGRVAISFAAGWQPNDFVLNPDAYATAKDDLWRDVELVRRLWRGDEVPMPGHDGRTVGVRTLPRPVQPELPVWLTSAGTPATFERAGHLGVNVLTHLLGQTVEQLAENIARYRAARRAAGHPGDGHVTLMLHTYLDGDGDAAREVARGPMKEYLGTAVGLLRDVASAFPTFANRGRGSDDLFANLSPDELDQLLDAAAERYMSSSGLIGAPAEGLAIVEAVSAVGVDEVACLVDFGVGTEEVLRSLDLLLEVKATVEARRRGGASPVDAAVPEPEAAVDDAGVAALVARHGITHLQCTPSLAAMLVADSGDREALRHVRHLMVGGEALPSALAQELRALLPARFTNMYGPTETTIWSLTHELAEAPGSVIPIGRPIANTTVFVLAPSGDRLPVGVLGELHIGGDGVARGYHGRPQLTAERFVERPGMGRVYATGDIVRIHPDGHVEFAGRADNQVKIRGYRVELGEIESVLDRHPEVVRTVVVAREDGAGTRLVAYVVLHPGADAADDDLRGHVAAALPEAMAPAVFVRVASFPLTPNGKVDRNALPAPTGGRAPDVGVALAGLADADERLVAEIWTTELERSVGRDDNFFDIGGHSLLAVKVFRRLTEVTGTSLALTDVFRYPTVRSFAAHLVALRATADDPERADAAPTATARSGTDRGAMRRHALARRSGPRGSGA